MYLERSICASPAEYFKNLFDFMKTLNSWEDLRQYLNEIHEKEPDKLKLPVQAGNPSPMEAEPVEMEVGVCIGTFDEMEFYAARSITNNQFNPNELCILLDGNPFGKDGAIAYQLDPNDKSEDNFFGEKNPIYSKTIGKTPIETQLNPKLQIIKDEIRDKKRDKFFGKACEIEIIKNRIDNSKL